MPTQAKRILGFVGAAALLDLIDFAIAGDLFAHVIGIASLAFSLHFMADALTKAMRHD